MELLIEQTAPTMLSTLPNTWKDRAATSATTAMMPKRTLMACALDISSTVPSSATSTPDHKHKTLPAGSKDEKAHGISQASFGLEPMRREESGVEGGEGVIQQAWLTQTSKTAVSRKAVHSRPAM